MKVIPETRHARYILYLRFYFIDQKDNSQSINFLHPLLLISADNHIVINCI